MEVQIFGTKSCHETQKALRFFKERRIVTHFVDLKERPASAGELRRFGQKLGWEELLDRRGKRFSDRQLQRFRLPASEISRLLEEDPLLLVTPLVRCGNDLAVGWDEARWRAKVNQTR
jgi:arsenate reductase-like glutaredoxin family protein